MADKKYETSPAAKTEKSWPEKFQDALKPAAEALRDNYGSAIDWGVGKDATQFFIVPRPVGPDQECWVHERIMTALRMVLAISREKRVCADKTILDSALDGIANGAAVEVIGHLGLRPGYRNLRRVDTDTKPAQGKPSDIPMP